MLHMAKCDGERTIQEVHDLKLEGLLPVVGDTKFSVDRRQAKQTRNNIVVSKMSGETSTTDIQSRLYTATWS